MTHVDSITGRAEIMAAIDILIDEVARLARDVDVIFEIISAVQVERNAATVHISAGSAICDLEPQKSESISDSRSQVSAEDEMLGPEVPLQPNGVASSEIEPVESCAAGDGFPPVSAVHIKSTDGSPGVESAVAKGIADLRDRLGGFLGPISLSPE